MVYKIVVTAFMVSVLVLSLARTAPAQSLDELYQLAKQEGQINLYGGPRLRADTTAERQRGGFQPGAGRLLLGVAHGAPAAVRHLPLGTG